MALDFTPVTDGPDLKDPKVLANVCRNLAGGMDQQATASQSGTALAGHPNPGFFYGDVAAKLRLAADMIEKNAPKPAKIEEKPAAKSEEKPEEPKPKK